MVSANCFGLRTVKDRPSGSQHKMSACGVFSTSSNRRCSLSGKGSSIRREAVLLLLLLLLLFDIIIAISIRIIFYLFILFCEATLSDVILCASIFFVNEFPTSTSVRARTIVTYELIRETLSCF